MNDFKDSSESFISGASVTLFDSSDNLVVTSTTDLMGEVVFTNIAAGSYTLVINVSGYDEKIISTSVVVNQVTIINVPLPSLPGAINSSPVLSASSNSSPSRIGQPSPSPVLSPRLSPSVASDLSVPTLSMSTGSLITKVFVDSNQNNLMDSNEQPVPGVSVEISDLTNTVVVKSVTDTVGQVVSDLLTTGSYSVTISVPGYEKQTISTSVTSNEVTIVNVPLPSLPDIADSLLSPMVQAAPSSSPGRNGQEPSSSGNVLTGTISGVAFEDTNGNGIQDTNEVTLSNVQVTIISTTTDTTVFEVATNVNGIWKINNIPSGTYEVAYTSPSDYTPTTYENGVIAEVVVTSGGSNWLPCGFQPLSLTGTITVSVCTDLNGDMLCSGSDTPLSDVPVKVYPEGSKEPVDVKPTGPDGMVTFELPPGKYVAELPPSNLYSGPDFEPDGVTPSSLDVPPGSYTALEAPLPNYGAIKGFVFTDNNGDGLQSPDEAGIKGLVVKIFDTSDTETPICINATDNTGAYMCSNLPLNETYIVKPASPYNGSEFTGEDVLNNETGESSPYTLTPTNTLATYDLGVVSKGGIEGNVNAASTPTTGSIVGTVWIDQNNDGRKSSGDSGMVGVDVHLGSSGDVLQTTSTDQQGTYSFPSVPVGRYTVTVDNPNPTYFSFVKTNSSDNNVDLYGASDIDVTSESASVVNAGMEQKPSTKVDVCTSNDRSTPGNPCNYIGTMGVF